MRRFPRGSRLRMQVRFAIRQVALVAVAALPLLSGCGESVDEAPTPPAAAPAPAAAISPTPTGADANASKSEATDIAPTEDKAVEDVSTDAADQPDVAKPALADYKAPFPDRVELFVAPKRQGGARSPGDENQDAVELLGFINVDRSKVVLSINGQVTPAAEGETQLGVEIISIQPPTVVLQRGRQRWSATLEN